MRGFGLMKELMAACGIKTNLHLVKFTIILKKRKRTFKIFDHTISLTHNGKMNYY